MCKNPTNHGLGGLLRIWLAAATWKRKIVTWVYDNCLLYNRTGKDKTVVLTVLTLNL